MNRACWVNNFQCSLVLILMLFLSIWLCPCTNQLLDYARVNTQPGSTTGYHHHIVTKLSWSSGVLVLIIKYSSLSALNHHQR